MPAGIDNAHAPGENAAEQKQIKKLWTRSSHASSFDLLGLRRRRAARSRSRRPTATPPASTWAFGALGQDVAQLGVVFVSVTVVDSHVPTQHQQLDSLRSSCRERDKKLPLKVIRAWILVLSVRAEGTHVAGRVVDEAVPDHLVFSLEPLPALASGAAFDAAVVGAVLGMYIGV
ncbi:hypothetical protein B2J93_8461 [Marssonina coronariae]|uniref:Uncharacterized protein n=1 Tax=Diplocarpon coronariae TaxID=2795749 RepID=A0A218YZH9_9HELO|nr:hypothetical protein B2J93_8461 [Marssonina coronariae]